ncbi:MAG: MotA/TolQ/ExbB proton channel family protein [Lentisphaeria bacterium]|nr:MotA/TolQ/ExbB proton channel family protein [Lentisphaeria bacterium]
MLKKDSRLLKFVCLALLGGGALFAQDAAPEATEAAAAGVSLWDILYGGSIVNLLIWLGLFGTSFFMLWLAIDAFIKVKRDKLIPTGVVNGVRDSLSQGDLGTAVATCDTNPGPLSNILRSAFENINDGYEVVQQAVSSSTDLESEKLMQRVNLLNICGQIAPMLGLMGTVTGMVAAFAGLANATGAAKAKLLAQSISTALWTTCIGLIIAVPALLFFTYYKNLATRILLETEATVLDLIKVLRNAEVEQ